MRERQRERETYTYVQIVLLGLYIDKYEIKGESIN